MGNPARSGEGRYSTGSTQRTRCSSFAVLTFFMRSLASDRGRGRCEHPFRLLGRQVRGWAAYEIAKWRSGGEASLFDCYTAIDGGHEHAGHDQCYSRAGDNDCRTQLKNSPPSTMIAPVFWAWAHEQAASDELLHVTRRRAISECCKFISQPDEERTARRSCQRS